MLSLRSLSNSNLKLSFLFVMFMALALNGSMASAKPAWKDDTSTGGSGGGSTKGGKGGGKTKTTTPVSDITIAAHPVSQDITEGTAVNFSVSASSTDGQVIAYQWYFDDQVISGATSDSFSIASTTLLDQGLYRVSLMTNDVSKNTEASLLVAAAPVLEPSPEDLLDISFHPQSQSVFVEDSLTLNVSAESVSAITYQWRKNGVDIVGATQAYLSLSNLSLADSAEYDVRVSNDTFATLSNVAIVTVKNLTTISLGWDIPTERDDGSLLSLAEIANYNIYISIEGIVGEEVISVVGESNAINLEGFTAGTYQFAIATIDTAGMLGSKSEMIDVIVN